MKKSIFTKILITVLLSITCNAFIWGQTEIIISFDISKGSVTFTDETYAGKNSDGADVNGTHNPDNIYIVSGTTTSSYIRVGDEKKFVEKNFIIHLNGVDIQRDGKDGCAMAVFNKGESVVAVILKNNSNNKLYSGYNRAGLEKGGGYTANGTLLITCEAGYTAWKSDNTHGHTTGTYNESACNETCGKLDARSGRGWKNFGSTQTYYYAGAGIGTSGQGTGGSSSSDVIAGNNALVNLTIAGGNITAAGTWGNTGGSSGGGASIGTGCASSSSGTAGTVSGLKITGGNINAYRMDNSAACIGGGYRSGYVTMDIYGGTIIANDLSLNSSNVTKMRAAAIGGGGGGTGSASPAGATVRIHNGKITASGHYGSAIGSGAGGSTGHGQSAEIIIKNGYITATTTMGENGSGNGAGAAIGAGGSLSSGYAGNANITINGGKIIASSQLGADIGGGGTNSTNTGDYGGKGTVNITGGNITANTGGIGGGRANKGAGGNAEINISGNNTTITAKSIGGGRSKSNNGGNVTLTVNNGSLTVADFIGGGICDNDVEKLGWAKVYINGGTISGRTVMKASSTDGCIFEMSGGTLTSPITNEAGGAVYMIDPNGTATLRGGTIQNCQGTTGGAVYMTGGTFTISENGQILNNTATQNGAAVYLAGTGKVIVNGGNITGADNKNVEAIYMAGGEFTMAGGTIEKFQGVQSGAVNMANGTFTMTNGKINNCNGTESGAIYMSGGTFEMSGGTILNCNGAQNGGAVNLAGEGTVNVSGGTISGNNVTNFGGAVYMNGGRFTISGGNMTNNTATKNGAAVYLAGEGQVFVQGGSITGAQSTNVEAIYMAGGEFNMSGGTIANFKGVQSGAVNMAAGSFTMTNGLIDNCSGTSNGAVYMMGGTFGISGGTISNCKGAQNGGAVNLAGEGTLNINGGTIRGNQVTKDGGAIYLNAGTFNMTAGTVQDNQSSGGNGAGIYVSNGTVSLTGGEVTGNIATKGKGGGFYVAGGTVTLSNGTISYNKAKSAGGGICLEGNADVTPKLSMTVEGCTLTGNEATYGNGGGIFLSNANMTYNGGILTFNKATYESSSTQNFTTGYNADASTIKGVGGGIYISTNSKLTFGNFGSLGVYANTADISADDLFANGNNTSLLLPNISKMSLDSYAGNADGLGWYEDYFVGDTQYDIQNIAKGSSEKQFEKRFRKAQELGRDFMRLYSVTGDYVTLDNYYISLALGFLFSDLTIKINGLNPGENCIVSVQGTAENGKYKYQVPVCGTSDLHVVKKIVKLPVDKYTVTLMQNWPWAYNMNSSNSITKMNNQDGGVYEFWVDHKRTPINHDEKKLSIELE